MNQPNPTAPGPSGWNKCNSCKKMIPFGGTYYKCSVSTCNRKRFQLHFCTVDCWDAHIPGQNHREAHCTEHKAPAA